MAGLLLLFPAGAQDFPTEGEGFGSSQPPGDFPAEGGWGWDDKSGGGDGGMGEAAGESTEGGGIIGTLWGLFGDGE